MRKLAGLDPSIRGNGVSIFYGTELARAAYIPNPVKKGDDVAAVLALAHATLAWFGSEIAELDIFVFERPQMYEDAPGRRKRKGAQNVLPPLYAVDCAVGMALTPRTTPITLFPHDWKGNIDPDVMTNRIWGRLSEVERARVQLRSSTYSGAIFKNVGDFDHNTLDGVGLILHYLHRLDPVKVFA